MFAYIARGYHFNIVGCVAERRDHADQTNHSLQSTASVTSLSIIAHVNIGCIKMVFSFTFTASFMSLLAFILCCLQ